MTTELDAKIVPKIAAVIARVGVVLTVTPKPTTYDPATLTTGSSGSPWTAKATPAAPISRDLLASDPDLSAEDLETYIAGQGLAVVPEVGDRAAFADGKPFRVIGVRGYKSGDLTAAWGLILRR